MFEGLLNRLTLGIQRASRQSVALGFNSLMTTTGDTLYYMAQIPSATASFIASSFHDRRSADVMRHVARIGYENVLPAVLVNIANNYFQQVLAYPDSEWDEAGTEKYLLWLLSSSASVISYQYQFKQMAAVAVREGVLLTEYPEAFNQATGRKPPAAADTICRDCSTSRRYKGEVRDFLVYLAQLTTIEMVATRLPAVGPLVAPPLRWLLNGQLFLAYRLANDKMCDRHRGAFYQQYMELCLALGLSHELCTKLTVQLLERVIPALSAGTLARVNLSPFLNPLQQLMIIPAIGVAHHLTLPRPVKQANRQIVEPLAWLRYVLGEGLDLLIPGLKVKLPLWLASGGKPLPWYDLLVRVHDIYQRNATQWYLMWVLPEILVSDVSFMADSVVKAYVPQLITRCIAFIEQVERFSAIDAATLSQHLVDGRFKRAFQGTSVNIANLNPELSAVLADELGGLSPAIVKTVLECLSNVAFMNKLSLFKAKLKRFGVEKDLPLIEAAITAILSYSGGRLGDARASNFQRLFAQCAKPWQKYLLCLALAKNKHSQALKQRVATAIGFHLAAEDNQNSQHVIARIEQIIKHSVNPDMSASKAYRFMEEADKLVALINQSVEKIDFQEGPVMLAFNCFQQAIASYASTPSIEVLQESTTALVPKKRTDEPSPLTLHQADKDDRLKTARELTVITEKIKAALVAYHPSQQVVNFFGVTCQGINKKRVYIYLFNHLNTVSSLAIVSLAVMSDPNGNELRRLVQKHLRQSSVDTLPRIAIQLSEKIASFTATESTAANAVSLELMSFCKRLYTLANSHTEKKLTQHDISANYARLVAELKSFDLATVEQQSGASQLAL